MNKLIKLPSQCLDLEELMCDSNQITEIPIYPKVRFIHCINNPITKINDYLPRLQELMCNLQSIQMSKEFKIINVIKSGKFIQIMFAPLKK